MLPAKSGLLDGYGRTMVADRDGDCRQRDGNGDGDGEVERDY